MKLEDPFSLVIHQALVICSQNAGCCFSELMAAARKFHFTVSKTISSLYVVVVLSPQGRSRLLLSIENSHQGSNNAINVLLIRNNQLEGIRLLIKHIYFVLCMTQIIKVHCSLLVK